MPMNRLKLIAVGLMAAIFTQSACAFFTVQRVGTMAAKHVATSAAKKAIQNQKDNKSTSQPSR